ncbi:addiction module protein [Tautonia sp. JC769]|uniref:addiction module protein n=1 Tax=Tautonia sp. JC769 TaxID=3232135 RepID=UPI0034574D27
MDFQTILTTLDTWPPEDRLRLIEAVWDRLAHVPDADRLTEAQRLDLRRRLDAYRDDPRAGSPWQEVKARLQSRS